MTEKRSKLLKDFKAIALELRTLLRKNPPLMEAEQLAIENCLLMLQMEYAKWRKHDIEQRTVRDTRDGTTSTSC